MWNTSFQLFEVIGPWSAGERRKAVKWLTPDSYSKVPGIDYRLGSRLRHVRGFPKFTYVNSVAVP